MMGVYRVFVIIFFIGIWGCKGDREIVFESIDFVYDSESWDLVPYKFSDTIEYDILQGGVAQMAATDYSSIGNYDKLLKTWDTGAAERKKLPQEEIDVFEKFTPIDAHDIIIEKSRDTKITIVNEAHHIPQHRVFTTSLLQVLWDNGYRHIGLEAYFSTPERDSNLANRGYPLLKDGFYVKEPQLGNLIREALSLGYKVFGYDSVGHGSPKEREIGQAKNIQEYISSNPEGKVLIHCGYAHGAEGEYGGNWERTMAARLTEYMGINPLTVDQTKYREMSYPLFENQYYAIAEVDKPSVYVNGDERFGTYRPGSWFDLYVFHPRTQNRKMPEWLLYDEREVVDVSFENEEINCPCMVLSYKDGEKVGSAVPYHVVETREKNVQIVLEKGRYQVVVLSHDGSALITSLNR